MPPIGKKPSGAQYRKMRKQREIEERVKAEIDTGACAKMLETIGDLPLDDPETATPWFQRAQLVLLGEILKDPSIPVREKFAAVKQMSEARAKTSNASALEARLADVEKQISGSRAKGAVEVKPTHGLPRPPTARGRSRARGPRAVEEPPARPDGT